MPKHFSRYTDTLKFMIYVGLSYAFSKYQTS